MAFSQQRRSTPAPVGVSPFLSDDAPSFGARFNLSGASSLPSNQNGSRSFSEAKYAHPVTPYQRNQSAYPTVSPSASPFASSPRESPSSSMMQSPSGGDRNNSWTGSAWGTPAAAPSQTPIPIRTPFASSTPFLSTPISSYGGLSASPPPSTGAHLRTPAASSTNTSRSSASTHVNTNSTHASVTSRPLSSAASFSHPDLERIAYQLRMVALHKTTSNLILSFASLALSAILLALCLKPFPDTPVMGGLMIVTHNIKLIIGALAAWFLWIGSSGLWRYSSYQIPRKEMEGLSEKQRRLMGWSGEQQSNNSRDQGRYEQGRMQDRNALRARARVQQLTGVTAAADMTASRTPSSNISASIASRALSPIPAASLRFLGAAPQLGLGRSPAAADFSPFKVRGFDSSSSATGAGRINDEASLSSFAREFDSRHRSSNTHDLHHSSPPHAHAPFATPPNQGRSLSGISPRNSGFGGLFGFGSSAAVETPPYATSLREAPVQLKSSSLALTSSGLGVRDGLASGMATFSFHLPGHRFPLDDPRSDSDLHDTFHSQLRSPLRTNAHMVDQYARNMRSWIVVQILRPLLQQLDSSNVAMARFAAFALQQPGVEQAFQEKELQMLRELAQAFSSPSASMPPLTGRHEEAIDVLCTRFGARAEVLQRLALEKYLAVENKSDASATVSSIGLFGGAPVTSSVPVSASTRAHVAQTLVSLSPPGDDTLSKFQLGGSGGAPNVRTNPFAGLFGTRSGAGIGMGASTVQAITTAAAAAASSSTFPSHAQIIFHCWCTHMDRVQANFTQQYVKNWNGNTLTHAQMPTTTSASAVSLSSSRSPSSSSAVSAELLGLAQVRSPSLSPYFLVTHASSGPSGSRRESVKLVTEPGRASLFQALVFFIMHLPRGSTMLREFEGVIQDN